VSAGERVFVTAPTKLNLLLHVGDKRPDGFHDLESLVVFVTHQDGIWLEPADEFALSVTGPFAAFVPHDGDNLVLRAARLLAERSATRMGANITLQKLIPAAAGLGGGSADAAAILRGLVRLWNLDLDRQILREIAASIGADVPVCVDSVTAWMEGRGERVTPLSSLPSFWLLLVNPGVEVSTARVFATLHQRSGLGLKRPDDPIADAFALADYLRPTRNDLEIPACAIAPEIGQVLEEIAKLPGVLLARMSGSGATCFGMFESHDFIMPAAQLIKSRHPDWWIIGVRLLTEQLASLQ
jgi:4-diphosphocytidyl-2-C-methyl-D-erythritol kinase